MKWNSEAAEAVKRVPFFVRKRVKTRVEEEAARRGDNLVTLEHVETCRKRFLNRMEDEVKGYQVETCFGPGGCPNRAVISDGLAERIERILARRDMKGFLREKVGGPLKFHHEFRVSISDCPNGCSRPQIVDVGLMGARQPGVSEESCSRCGNCVEVCKESAVFLDDDGPVISQERCLSCGACIRACPTGTLVEASGGYRVLLGGKLGRHPRLGQEIPGIHSRDQVIEIIEHCIDRYRKHSRHGERLGEVLGRVGMKKFFEDKKAAA
ncbi:MAG TPA: 4Fe-4S dicluster domain-containing protein [Desulfobacteraceae bacterium]|nr:MAG: sulfite reductase [Desulfobacteraceae bacterium 4484_190.3]RLB18163.1 MAG: sulfite reductase [Deltaproteobacteria bacterium]HDZ24598.1 4Fe-4S dicluster domain-containing protein [Desulfobacteraceae bacterium]